MSGSRVDVFGGVDTHRDFHVAAVADGVGRVVGSESFAAEATGYEQLVAWLRSKGGLIRVGVEGTGSYGAGLARYLTEAGVEVVEVNRPNRQLHRQRDGKTDSVDAEGAARAAASGQATSVPKSGDGPVECLRMLLVARRSATKARTQAANQIHSLVVTAPEPLNTNSVASSSKLGFESVPAGVPAKHRPLRRTRRELCATWLADTKLSTLRSPNSRETSAVSALGRTRPCWPPQAWALTQPPPCWSPPATTPDG